MRAVVGAPRGVAVRTTPHWWATTFVEDLKAQLKREQGVELAPQVEGQVFSDTLKLIQDVAADTRADVAREQRWPAS